MEGILDRLGEAEDRFAEFERLISDPRVISGDPRYQEYLRAHGRVYKTVALAREYRAATEELVEAERLAAGEDAELRELAREELPKLRSRTEELFDRIETLFSERGEGARSAILEIRAGVGGGEAALFARDLVRMYERFCKSMGWEMKLLDVSQTDLGGLKDAVVSVRGEGVYGRLKYEGGVHRVQRVPETEASGRIHTSAATVAVMPEAREIDVKLDDKDLEIKVMRSPGPGGQSVNTTDAAVFIKHLPTGEFVKCQIHKSQHQNRFEAMNILRSRLYEHEQERRAASDSALRRGQTGTGDRSERVRTYNFPQSRVTDHRLEGEEKNFNLDRVLEGDVGPIIERLRAQERARRRGDPTPAPEGGSGARHS